MTSRQLVGSQPTMLIRCPSRNPAASTAARVVSPAILMSIPIPVGVTVVTPVTTTSASSAMIRTRCEPGSGTVGVPIGASTIWRLLGPLKPVIVQVPR